ncbi:MAG: hypothetical protein ABL908_06580 [Hyphomicrobium sp.]
MKWILVVMVFGTSPVKTDTVYNTLEDCLAADDAMRSAYVEHYNDWIKRAKADPKRYNYPESDKYAKRRYGLENVATCVPL